jgi:hypothetical protein
VSTFLLAAILVATGAVGVATLVIAIGVASFVLTTGPLAYRLTLVILLCVALLVEVVMVIFGALGVLGEVTQVISILTSAFAVLGALVGGYFGVQINSDLNDKSHSEIEYAKHITAKALGEMDPETSSTVVRDTSQMTQ